MRSTRKLICLLLAAVLCIGLLPQTALASNTYTDYQTEFTATHILEITTGEVGKSVAAMDELPITISIDYYTYPSLETDPLSKKTYTPSGAGAKDLHRNLFPYLSDHAEDTVFDVKASLLKSNVDFEDLTDTQMHTLMTSYTGQRNRGTYTATLRSYTTTYVALDLGDSIYDKLHHIESITIGLYGTYPANSISIQGVRLFEYFDTGSKTLNTYWNGGYSQERIPMFDGILLASSGFASTHSLTAGGSLTFFDPASQNTGSNPKLEYVLDGEQFMHDAYYATDEESEKYIVSSAHMVDAVISLDIANIAGAGIESLLAVNPNKYVKNTLTVPAVNSLSANGLDVGRAYEYLSPNVDNALKLNISYKDDLGRTRRVSIPFIGMYLTYILKENNGRLGAGTNGIFGVLQQGQTVGFPFRLANYESLISIELTYGAADDYTMVDNTVTDMTSSEMADLRIIDCDRDTLSVEGLSFYVEENVADSFSAAYDSKRWDAVLRCDTDLTADYSYSAPSYKGSILRANTALQLMPGDGKLIEGGQDTDRTLSDTYLVEITSASVEKSSTNSLLTLDLTYVDKNGTTKTVENISTQERVGSLYGFINRSEYDSIFSESADSSVGAYAQYQAVMAKAGSTLRFLIEGLPDVDHFVSVTYRLGDAFDVYSKTSTVNAQNEGVNEYQAQSIFIYRATGLGERCGTGEVTNPTLLKIMDIEVEHDELPVAFSNRQVLLQEESPNATINLTYVSSDGNTVTPESDTVFPSTYLNGLPTAMTYEDTLQDLGLSIPKYDYQVTVNVSDEEESGSQNYFFFQLVFEHGTSGMVLANQQLQSDSFRAGYSESFVIRTTQNYGDLVSIRIVCDRMSEESDVFDKLNVDSITVTVNGLNGVVEVWTIDNVGWIDITYTDQGSEYYYAGSGDAVGLGSASAKNNASIVKEYMVTGTDTQVMLQFCIATANSSTAGVSSYANALHKLGGEFYVTIDYISETGQSKTISHPLTDLIYEYNGTDDTEYLFRPNHIDRFTISTTDMQSLRSITLSRTNGQADWVVKNVTVQLVSERTDVYLQTSVQENVVSAEFIRNVKTQADLAESLNTENITVGLNDEQTLYFSENTVSVAPDADTDSWNATVTRVPQSNSNTLNIYLFPGARTVAPDKIVPFTSGLTVALNYTTLYGGNTVQTLYDLDVRQTEDGGTMLYGAGLSADAMSTLCSMTVKKTDYSTYSDTMVVDYAVVEQVRNGVIVDTYFFDFNSDTSMDQVRTPNTISVGNPTTQRVRMQLAPGQTIALTPETYDVAVAIRYTSASDVTNSQKQVFRSPYVYLTDQEYLNLVSGQDVYLDLAVPNVGKIVGVSVVTSGPIVTFEKCAVYGFAADGQTLSSVCSIVNAFTATTTAQSITAGETDELIPSTFTFTTAEDTKIADAGTSGQVKMTIRYLDDQDKEQETVIENIYPYISSGSLEAGSTATMSIMLDNAKSLLSLEIMPIEDDWFITSVSAQLQLTLDQIASCTTTVYNWAKVRETLTIDVRPATERAKGEVIGNELKSLSLSAQSRDSKEVASATSGNILQIKAYPGDLVTFDPYLVYIGNPDTSLVWSSADPSTVLVELTDDTASFYVPAGATPGTNYNFSLQCTIDDALMIPITVSIIEVPHEHEYTETVTDPTCTEQGFTTFTCECGESYIGDEVAASGHSYETETVAPDCTQEGYTVYTCSVCSDSYTDDTLPALGHSYESETIDAGYVLHTCSVCGDTEYESVETEPAETQPSETEPTQPETEPAAEPTEEAVSPGS